MNALRTAVLLAATPLVIAGCTSGQSAVEPSSTPQNIPATTKLQFAVGTANVAGTPGLNAVATFRNLTTGNSATLVNTPTITGPAGFLVPAGATGAGVDAGTGQISGSPQVPPTQTPIATTFGESGGVFSYGFAPANIDTSQTANYPTYSTANGVLNVFALPFYGATTLSYVVGPPAAPFFADGTQPSGFLGYPAGFTDFSVTPVAGAYTLAVQIPGTTVTTSATASLASTALLPTFPTPTFTSDTTGGGTIGVTIPAGVTETLVFVLDTTSGTAYTVESTATGAQTLTLPDSLGDRTSPTATPSLSTGDSYLVYAVGFDYPALEAGPPGNRSATPTIVGTNGQADITTSAALAGTY